MFEDWFHKLSDYERDKIHSGAAGTNIEKTVGNEE